MRLYCIHPVFRYRELPAFYFAACKCTGLFCAVRCEHWDVIPQLIHRNRKGGRSARICNQCFICAGLKYHIGVIRVFGPVQFHLDIFTRVLAPAAERKVFLNAGFQNRLDGKAGETHAGIIRVSVFCPVWQGCDLNGFSLF